MGTVITSGDVIRVPDVGSDALSVPFRDTLGNQAIHPLHTDCDPSPSCPPLCRRNHILGDGLSPTITNFMGVRRAITWNVSIGCDEDEKGNGAMSKIVLVFRLRLLAPRSGVRKRGIEGSV